MRSKGEKGKRGKWGRGEMEKWETGFGFRDSGFRVFPEFRAPCPFSLFPFLTFGREAVEIPVNPNSTSGDRAARPEAKIGDTQFGAPFGRLTHMKKYRSERKGRRSRDTAPEHDTANMDARQRRMRVAQTSDFEVCGSSNAETRQQQKRHEPQTRRLMGGLLHHAAPASDGEEPRTFYNGAGFVKAFLATLPPPRAGRGVKGDS